MITPGFKRMSAEFIHTLITMKMAACSALTTWKHRYSYMITKIVCLLNYYRNLDIDLLDSFVIVSLTYCMQL